MLLFRPTSISTASVLSVLWHCVSAKQPSRSLQGTNDVHEKGSATAETKRESRTRTRSIPKTVARFVRQQEKSTGLCIRRILRIMFSMLSFTRWCEIVCVVILNRVGCNYNNSHKILN